MKTLVQRGSSFRRLARLVLVAPCLVPVAAEARPRDGKIVVRPNRIVVVPPRGTVIAPVPALVPSPFAATPGFPAPVAAVVPAPRLFAPRRIAIVPATPIVAATAFAPVVTQVVRETVVVPEPAAPGPAVAVPAVPPAVPAPTPAAPSVIVQPPVEILPTP